MTPGTIFLSSQEGEPTENDVIRFQCDESDGIFQWNAFERQMDSQLFIV